MNNKRISTIILVLALVILSALLSWVLGTRIQSPVEVAAQTAPPVPSPILVPIEKRVLTSNIVTRGTARFGLPQSISIVPSALKGGAGVIATVPLRNTQLKEGDVVLIASGRPVFVLQGEIPTYRDLSPGISGEDVRQFEDALIRMGFDPGPVDGTFDTKTCAAVEEWYTTSGWEPFGPTSNQLVEIRALEEALSIAQNDKTAAEDAATASPLVVNAARANAESANKMAAVDVAAKVAVRDKVLADTTVTDEEQATAVAQLDVAEAAARAVQLEGEVAIQAALDAQKAAERRAKLAAERVTQLADALDKLQQNSGIQVPADEIVFLPTLPVRVEQIDVLAGDAASGPVLKITNNQLSIDSSLPLDEAALVKPGMAVVIDEPDLGISATGVVERVANTPGTDGVDGFHIYFEVLVDETSTDIEGFSLRLTIPVESTGGVVTAVPVSALSLAADGTSRVQIDKGGALEFVIVEPGLSAAGYVEVTPIEGTLEAGQLVLIGFE